MKFSRHQQQDIDSREAEKNDLYDCPILLPKEILQALA